MTPSPSRIDSLKANEVFVFGSNKKGKHHHGAAVKALDFGAVIGQNEGLQGQAYAINTKNGMDVIASGVKTFIQFAFDHPNMVFLVTPIGCGLAKHSPDEVAPLFSDAMTADNIRLPQSFLNILEKTMV